jgi:uncharacterized membrane protein
MRVHWSFVVPGVILAALGTVWALQGVGLLLGSVMTGQPLWIWIGIPVAMVGLGLIGFGLLRRT